MLVAGLICGLALDVNACTSPGDLYGPGVSATTVPVQGVTVAPQSIQFTAIGETRNLSARIFPSNATDRAVTWESTDTTVATVDTAGRVTARAAGFAVLVTAFTHDGHHEASASVSVNP